MSSDPEEPSRVLGEAHDNGTVIVVFANSTYRNVLCRWLQAIGKLGLSNYVVVALDGCIWEEMKQQGKAVLYRPCSADLESIWVHRTEVLLELLETGFNLVHSDADALWLKNPLDKYVSATDHDLIFSTGTYWPPDVHKEWGFVVCCGFYYVRSNERTRAFFAELAELVRIERDDQISMNRLLLKRGLFWGAQDSYEVQISNTSVKFHTVPADGNAGGLKVRMLPHAQFQRLPAAKDDLYIQHWLSDKTPLGKQEVLGGGG